ncbi:P2X purinoceptor 2 [Labeo rohita]|uniref:P2X purinoceptor 2 n=1 Tax=Labeo rohita TaxID=84645 RepID=A0A498NG14_LABRO|nr:P2X purinoceptor 2 [Labeo rohita]
MGCLEFLKDFFLGFWDYETPKVMVVKDKKLGVIYRAVQFLVITYFIWYVFISQKAYQETETRPESSVYTEMRGVAMLGDSVQDTTEYVRPSEHYSVANANCTKDSDCTQGEIDFDGHGQRTGRCIQYYNYTFKTCEIKTWCPIEEYAVVREPALEQAINFTVFIKNAIHFPKFKVLRFAKYYHKDGVEYRTLIKAYGIRLDVIVHGHAGRFSLIPTIINTVTAMTSVGICSIICDWIMLTFIDKNEVFSEKKFDDVSKKPSQPITTDLTLTSYGSTHSDLSDGVPL